MKKIIAFIICLSTIVILFSCDTNKKLKQENAERVIKDLITSINTCGGKVKLQSIEPINQFSENESSIIVHTIFSNQYVTWNWNFKFIFNKNIDKKWILASVNEAPESTDGSSCLSNLCEKWQDLNQLVQ